MKYGTSALFSIVFASIIALSTISYAEAAQQRPLSDLFSDSWLAQASAALTSRAGASVKVVVPENRLPPTEFDSIPKSAKITKPELCLDTMNKKVYAQNSQPFESDWASRSKCAQGLADATVIENKIADLTSSLDIINVFIESLKTTVTEVNAMKTLDGATFAIIPAGEKVDKEYEQGKSIALKCVSDAQALVGTVEVSKAKLYADITPALMKKVEAVKAKIDKSYQEFLKEAAKDPGKVSGGTLDRLGLIKSTLQDGFILISSDAFSKKHAYLGDRGAAIPLSIAMHKNSDGSKQACTSFGLFVESKLAIAGVGKNFSKSSITLNGKNFNPECIPEAYLLGELKSGAMKDLATFEALKAEYEKQIQELKRKLIGLTAVKYYCTTINSSQGNPEINTGSNGNGGGNTSPGGAPRVGKTSAGANSGASQAQVNIQSAKTTFASSESAQFSVSYPSNTERTILSITCPTGVSSLNSRYSCNQLNHLGKVNSVSLSFVNRASDEQKVVLKFYAYDGNGASLESFPLSISVAPKPALVLPPPRPASYQSPIPSYTPVYSPTYTPTYSATPSYIYTPTYSPSYSPTYTPTYTPTPTATVTSTPSPTVTPTITTSPTASPSPSSTSSSSPSPTSSPSSSASPSSSPMP